MKVYLVRVSTSKDGIEDFKMREIRCIPWLMIVCLAALLIVATLYFGKENRPMRKTEVHLTEKSPLKWAEGWNRTPIGDRRPMKAWKKPFTYYRDALVDQLAKIGATEIMISFNVSGDDSRRDPGVTIYFSKPLKEDYGWQMGLGIDNPAPTLDEIDEAYRKRALLHHPDRGGDVEIFKKLGAYREQARAWVKNTHSAEHEYALPCDRFTEPRWNLNALRLGVAALRRLEEFGLPGMLERTFRGFRVALAQNASSSSEDRNVGKAVNS
jgi:hypothetical protein